MIQIRLDNGRIIVREKGKKRVRYIPWNCIKLGKIIDANQVYYHLGKVLEDFTSRDPIKLLFPSPKTYTFSYPHQDLSLSECKKIENRREEERQLNPKTCRKEVFLTSKRHLVYYDEETMICLDKIFKDLGRTYDRVPWVNTYQDQVLCSPEYVYTYQPLKEEGLAYNFSKEGVDFFTDLDMTSEQAYQYLEHRISLEEDEKLDYFLTLFYLEHFSNIQETLKEAQKIAIDQGRYKEDYGRFYTGRFEDLIYEEEPLEREAKGRGLKDKVSIQFPRVFGKHSAYGLILGGLILAMGLHYYSLNNKLSAATPTSNIKYKVGPRYNKLFQSLDLSRLKFYEFTYDQDQARLRAKVLSLEEAQHLKSKLENQGHTLSQEDIQFEDGFYNLDWTID